MRAAYAWLLIAGFGAAYAALALFAFDAFPYSGDEYSVLLQAEAFGRGVLHGVAPPHAAELMRVDHVVIDEWVRSKYPPGASALLALGVRAGLPWLVAPLEGVVTLALMAWTARRELGAAASWITLLVLGFAPLFVFHASTFFSHPATTMWLALAFTATSEWARSRRDAWLLLLGAALGAAFITRPLDAVLFGAALLVLRSVRLVVLSALGGLPFAVAHFWYQARQFGSPFTDGYHAYEPTFRAIYGDETAVHPVSLRNLFSPVEQFHHVDVLRAFVVDWTVAGTALVAVLGAFAIGRDHDARKMRNVAVSIAVVLLVALLPMVSDPDDGARPRYLSTMLLSVAFLAGPGWVVARDFLAVRIGPRLTRAVAVLAVVFAPVQIGSFLMWRLPLQWQREGLFKAVAKEHPDRAVVVIRARYPTRYARNGAFLDGPVLYLSAPAATTPESVAAAFPERDIYEATEGQEWSLVKRVARRQD